MRYYDHQWKYQKYHLSLGGLGTLGLLGARWLIPGPWAVLGEVSGCFGMICWAGALAIWAYWEWFF